MSSLLPGGAGWGGVSGSVLAVFDPTSGASLLPLSIDPALFARESFVWGDEPWLTVRHKLHEPPVDLVLAAPLAPFAEPFQQAARRNLYILGIVALAVVGLATLLTRRTTRALVRLASAAEAVSLGDLDRKVEEESGDEVGRVARAFNSMTESLRRTLRELSQRQALAAVGEFAASPHRALYPKVEGSSPYRPIVLLRGRPSRAVQLARPRPRTRPTLLAFPPPGCLAGAT